MHSGTYKIAKYITASHFHEKKVFGAAYDENMRLCNESLRDSRNAGPKHADSEHIIDEYITTTRLIKGKSYYLGHAFSNYGHFLLETLPMLSYAVKHQNEDVNFITLPFRKNNDSFIKIAAKVLDINPDRFICHNKNETL